MNMKRHIKPIPEGMHTVTPQIICKGAAEAIEFYKRAFNAVEVGRMPGPDGKLLHAMIRIGDSAIMLVDEFPEFGMFGPKIPSGAPANIHLYVEDIDTLFEQAVKAGAMIIMPPRDMFWGDRYGELEDPFGHHWSVATHILDVSLEEMEEAARMVLLEVSLDEMDEAAQGACVQAATSFPVRSEPDIDGR